MIDQIRARWDAYRTRIPDTFWVRYLQLSATALLLVLVVVGFLGLLRNTSLLSQKDHVWRAMEQRGTWRVGMDPSFPPFEMLDDEGRPIGFDVDLAREIAQRWGLEVEVVAVGFDSLLDALQADQIDSVVSAFPYDPRATRDVAFSAPYFEAGVRLAVRKDSPLDGVYVQDLDEFEALLANSRVAVEWGSMGDMVGRRLQRNARNIELLPYSTPDEAVSALMDDQSIANLLIDNVTLRQAQGAGFPLVAVGPALEGNPYVIALPIGAKNLQTKIKSALEELTKKGGIEELEAKWFGIY